MKSDRQIDVMVLTLRSFVPKYLRVYRDNCSYAIVITNGNKNRLIGFETIEDYIFDDNVSGLIDLINRKIDPLIFKYKKFNWPWQPEWKKQKEILFRKFNG